MGLLDMEDDLDFGLYVEDDDTFHEAPSNVSFASSSSCRSGLPRCAVVNFQRHGDSISMRPRAVTDTAGIAARIKSDEHSSFLLEEHSSRMLNFSPKKRRNSVEPIVWKAGASKGQPNGASRKGKTKGQEGAYRAAPPSSSCSGSEKGKSTSTSTSTSDSENSELSQGGARPGPGPARPKRRGSHRRRALARAPSHRHPGGKGDPSQRGAAAAAAAAARRLEPAARGCPAPRRAKAGAGRARTSAMARLTSLLCRFHSRALSDVSSEEGLSEARLSGKWAPPRGASQPARQKAACRAKGKYGSPMACFGGGNVGGEGEGGRRGGGGLGLPGDEVEEDEYSAFTSVTSFSISARGSSLRKFGRNSALERD